VEKFLEVIDRAVSDADIIREEFSNSESVECIRKIQAHMTNFAKKNDLPGIAAKALETNPSSKLEIQRRVIAVMGEGKRLEDSLIR
jgi:hypothetical protein